MKNNVRSTVLPYSEKFGLDISSPWSCDKTFAAVDI